MLTLCRVSLLIYVLRGAWVVQVGFVVALLAELSVPYEGLFGAWDDHSLSVFGASSLLMIAVAAVQSALSMQRSI